MCSFPRISQLWKTRVANFIRDVTPAASISVLAAVNSTSRLCIITSVRITHRCARKRDATNLYVSSIPPQKKKKKKNSGNTQRTNSYINAVNKFPVATYWKNLHHFLISTGHQGSSFPSNFKHRYQNYSPVIAPCHYTGSSRRLIASSRARFYPLRVLRRGIPFPLISMGRLAIASNLFEARLFARCPIPITIG